MNDSLTELLNPYQLGNPLKKAKPLPKEPLVHVSHRPITRSMDVIPAKDDTKRVPTALELITKAIPKA